MGKSTISMAIFHCYVSSPEGIPIISQSIHPVFHARSVAPRAWWAPAPPPNPGAGPAPAAATATARRGRRPRPWEAKIWEMGGQIHGKLGLKCHKSRHLTQFIIVWNLILKGGLRGYMSIWKKIWWWNIAAMYQWWVWICLEGRVYLHPSSELEDS